MKNTSVLFALILASVLYSCKPASEVYTDLSAAENGGFEVLKNGRPVNWFFYTAATTLGDFDILSDSTNAVEGRRSVFFNIRNCDGHGGRFSPGLFQQFDVQPSAHYTAHWFMRCTGTSVHATFEAINAESADQPHTIDVQDVGEWREFQLSLDVPANMTQVRFELNALRPGKLWVDAFRLQRE